MLTIGTYYYPEAWPEAEWSRDMANIRKLGMEYVHMGEFAWFFMEPQEGKFDFGWLEKNVGLVSKNGLQVLLCTPSGTPPVWLVKKHPEVLMVDAQGRTIQHGSLDQAAWSSPLHREYVGKISWVCHGSHRRAAGANAQILVGQREVVPGGATIWMEK